MWCENFSKLNLNKLVMDQVTCIVWVLVRWRLYRCYFLLSHLSWKVLENLERKVRKSKNWNCWSCLIFLLFTRSNTCPECQTECLSDTNRRLYFNSDPRDSAFKIKEFKYQEQIITLRNEMAAQIQQFEEQLTVEMQIREYELKIFVKTVDFTRFYVRFHFYFKGTCIRRSKISKSKELSLVVWWQRPAHQLLDRIHLKSPRKILHGLLDFDHFEALIALFLLNPPYLGQLNKNR